MAGNRLFFPVQAVMFYSGAEWDDLEESAKLSDGTKDYENADVATPYVAHGVQDVSITSNFALTPIFELGQSEVYENTEGMPTVEITLSKVLDGKPLLWHLATLDAEEPHLIARTAAYSTFQLGLQPDTQERCFWAPGIDTVGVDDTINLDKGGGGSNPDKAVTPIGVITCPKCFPSSLGYTINTTEASTENLTLSGNEKVWARAKQSNKKLPSGDAFVIQDDVRFNTAFANFKDNNDTPDQRIAQGYNVMLKPVKFAEDYSDVNPNNPDHVNRNTGALRDPDCSVFPVEIPGINQYGTNDVDYWVNTKEGVYQPDPNCARIQSVSFNVTLSRNDINALGYRLPVFKSVQMPIQVSTEITVVSTTDDGIQVSAFTSACQNTAALRPGTIRLAICNGNPPDELGEENAGDDPNDMVNGVRFYTGNQNKLTSVSFGQGGTGGGNVQATYSYQTNNTFTVVAKADPNMNQSPEPTFYESGDAGVIAGTNAVGEIKTPGGWWINRADYVC